MSDLGKPVEPRGEVPSQRRYSRLVLNIALSISLVSVIPLLVLSWFNYYELRHSLGADAIRAVERATEAARSSVECLLSTRRMALALAARTTLGEELLDPKGLERLLGTLQASHPGFLGLGLADREGCVVSRTDAHGMPENALDTEPWFREALEEGAAVSEVRAGDSGLLTFRTTIRIDLGNPGPHVLWATNDAEVLAGALAGREQEGSEAFLVNREGRLQTPSPLYGPPLTEITLPGAAVFPPPADGPIVDEIPGDGPERRHVGCVSVEGSPFVLVLTGRSEGPDSWIARRHNLVLFTGSSVLLIVIVVTWGSMRIGTRLVRSDLRRAAMYHQLEYTNKMAAIGRLGAGVAHEINNPLAIIGEKAGLVRDLLTIAPKEPSREKLLEQIDSIQSSVERCSKITHRLLGFAKHMEVEMEEIDLRDLLREVLSFLDKEAGYRSITVHLDVPEDFPNIVSDRGQIEQVFLNVVNNAFAAVDEGGEISLTGEDTRDGFVIVHIEDDGIGIPEDYLKHVFEPFFTTKGGTGTGLGLSITYGIVGKVGGSIAVRSKVGEGTRFSIRLPLQGGEE